MPGKKAVHSMRRVLVISGLISLAVFILYEVATLEWIIWDGSFDLTVQITNSSPEPIHAVSCHALGSPMDAQAVLKMLIPPAYTRYSASADPFVGEPLIVEVPLSGRDSLFGWEPERSQARYLVVIAEFQGSKRFGKLVDLPDCRDATSVTVNFP